MSLSCYQHKPCPRQGARTAEITLLANRICRSNQPHMDRAVPRTSLTHALDDRAEPDLSKPPPCRTKATCMPTRHSPFSPQECRRWLRGPGKMGHWQAPHPHLSSLAIQHGGCQTLQLGRNSIEVDSKKFGPTEIAVKGGAADMCEIVGGTLIRVRRRSKGGQICWPSMARPRRFLKWI